MADTRLTVKLRVARSDDLAQLLDLLDELREKATPSIPWERADDATTRAAWEQILADVRRTVIVAEAERQIVGTADVVITANLTHGARPLAAVENVVVTSRVRGRGVGRALMDEVLAVATAAGCYKIEFLSNKQRTDAHAFYRALGFEPTSEGFRRDL